MFTNLNRVFKFAFTDFSRNLSRSISAVFVVVVTILLVTGLFFMHGISNYIIAQVQNKIDITAYFKDTTAETDILSAKDQILQADPAIKNIQYVSKDDALAIFTQKHSGDPVLANALTQVGDNPFLASLNITTNGDAAEYQKIATLLQGDAFASLIDKVDYSDKKDTIDTIFAVTSGINTFGIGLAILLVFIAVLIVYNTIKLAIDNSREEINTMRMVGASAWFVRAPFVIQGAMFGAISFVICFIITLAMSYFLSPKLLVVLGGFNILNYFLVNFLLIFAIQLGLGIALGVVASAIGVQKYLKV